jgi:hypothetical protein
MLDNCCAISKTLSILLVTAPAFAVHYLILIPSRLSSAPMLDKATMVKELHRRSNHLIDLEYVDPNEPISHILQCIPDSTRQSSGRPFGGGDESQLCGHRFLIDKLFATVQSVISAEIRTFASQSSSEILCILSENSQC